MTPRPITIDLSAKTDGLPPAKTVLGLTTDADGAVAIKEAASKETASSSTHAKILDGSARKGLAQEPKAIPPTKSGAQDSVAQKNGASAAKTPAAPIGHAARLPSTEIRMPVATSPDKSASQPQPAAIQKIETRVKEANKFVVWGIVALIVVVIGVLIWSEVKPSGPGPGFVSGNGRIEATEIDIATKLAGRVDKIMVDEGDFVEVGEPLAQMQIDVLNAKRDEARAQSAQAVTLIASDRAQVVARRSDTTAAQAVVAEHASDLDVAQRKLVRYEALAKAGAVSLQDLDDNRASVRAATAALAAAQAQVASTQAADKAAQAQVVGANSGVAAADATVASVQADIEDSLLKSPRAGRVQYRVAEPGEVLAAGGKVLNLVDLSDVYMTFYLPESAVGKVKLGSEVRLILDAAPQYVIPATVSYVASVAQFTPKTVETATERTKLMFRVRAQIGRDLLQKNLKMVKTGLPGVAWLKLDPNAKWPANLTIKVP